MKLVGEKKMPLGLVLIDKESLNRLKRCNDHWKGFYFQKRVNEDTIKTRRINT